jgi:hypothetical protein
VVKALCYKPEGRLLQTWWGEWIFAIYLILPAALGGPGVYWASNINEYQKQKNRVSGEGSAAGAYGWKPYRHLWADCVDLGSPNFFSLRAALTPPLSPKGQDLASSPYQHTVVLNYAQIFVLGVFHSHSLISCINLLVAFFPLSALLVCVEKHSPKWNIQTIFTDPN